MKTSKLIDTWERAYSRTIGNVKGYRKRLKELNTWDKPFVKKEDDKNGMWYEWACKILALENLLS